MTCISVTSIREIMKQCFYMNRSPSIVRVEENCVCTCQFRFFTPVLLKRPVFSERFYIRRNQEQFAVLILFTYL